MKRRLISAIWAFVVGMVPIAAIAQDAPPAPKWYDVIAVNAFISTSYSYNFNNPPGDDLELRVFDFNGHTFNIDVAELVVQKAPSGPGDWGFRMDFELGTAIPYVSASAGLFGTGGNIDLQQAFVSYIVKIGGGLRIDIGKFVTHAGYELIEGYDGFNDNYSRSILFGFAIPFTHTGVKASLPLSSAVSVMLMIVNGWDNVLDNNGMKTLGAQLGLTPIPGLSIYVNGLIGPEQDDEDSNLRVLLDVVAIYKLSPTLTLGVNFDFANESEAAAGESATWLGAAAYFRLDIDRFALALRGEVFSDSDGVRTGVDQTYIEFTVTPAFKVTDNFILRGDVRVDIAEDDIFNAEDDPSSTQFTIGLNALAFI